MSSILFTLDVLDLVLMVGVGVGEMGGDGESSPVIMGIDMVGGPASWLMLWEVISPALESQSVAEVRMREPVPICSWECQLPMR